MNEFTNQIIRDTKYATTLARLSVVPVNEEGYVDSLEVIKRKDRDYKIML